MARSRVLIWAEWGAVVLLVGGVAAYLLWKPLDPMADPRAARALALVQTHPARSPSIGQWTVRPDDRNAYHVRVVVRLPGDQAARWIEWEYLWRVRLSPPTVEPLSRPALEVMP